MMHYWKCVLFFGAFGMDDEDVLLQKINLHDQAIQVEERSLLNSRGGPPPNGETCYVPATEGAEACWPLTGRTYHIQMIGMDKKGEGELTTDWTKDSDTSRTYFGTKGEAKSWLYGNFKKSNGNAIKLHAAKNGTSTSDCHKYVLENLDSGDPNKWLTWEESSIGKALRFVETLPDAQADPSEYYAYEFLFRDFCEYEKYVECTSVGDDPRCPVYRMYFPDKNYSASWRHTTYSIRIHSQYADDKDVMLVAMHEDQNSDGVKAVSQVLHDLVYPDLSTHNFTLTLNKQWSHSCCNAGDVIQQFPCVAKSWDETYEHSTNKCFSITEGWSNTASVSNTLTINASSPGVQWAGVGAFDFENSLTVSNALTTSNSQTKNDCSTETETVHFAESVQAVTLDGWEAVKLAYTEWRADITGLKWTGKLTETFHDGTHHTLEVGGTYDAVDYSEVSYTTIFQLSKANGDSEEAIAAACKMPTGDK